MRVTLKVKRNGRRTRFKVSAEIGPLYKKYQERYTAHQYSDPFWARLYPFGRKKGRVRSSPVRHREVMMRTLPAMKLHLLNPFMPLFSRRLWPHVQVLLECISKPGATGAV